MFVHNHQLGNFLPENFSEYYKTRENIHNRSMTRYRKQIPLCQVKNKHWFKVYKNAGPALYNSLPMWIKDSKMIKLFKKHVRDLLLDRVDGY